MKVFISFSDQLLLSDDKSMYDLKIENNRLFKFLAKLEAIGFWFSFCLTPRSTVFQSFWDGATAFWVLTSTLEILKSLAQGHNTAVVRFEPCTSFFGVRSSTTEPSRPHPKLEFEKYN